ncbi:MAG: rRNA pseudouridine synthase [Clostridiales bacterium]|nr:rRNA pseudouridine synthase [Clostridiales bacterium]
MERLNKYLASCGVASRRESEKLILDGRVKVNGKVVKELGTQVNENNDRVSVDGNLVKPVLDYSYIMMYKPKGCVTTMKDDKGRKTVYSYLEDLNIPHLVPVGRLDYDTEGLLLLTNDGELVHALTHPSHEVPKTYVVKVEGEIPEHKLAQLRKGVEIDGVKTAKAKVKLVEFKDNISRFEMTIHEGRNRQIRKMFEAVGEEVIFLKRISVGNVRLGGLARGTYRYLNDDEIEYLKKL